MQAIPNVEHLRERLVFVFRCRGYAKPERLAHETLLQLEQRREQGAVMDPRDVIGYVLGTAERVARESKRRTAFTYAQSVEVGRTS
jgi:hypothetical protein